LFEMLLVCWAADGPLSFGASNQEFDHVV